MQQALRSATAEDLMKMELGELETLVQRGNAVFGSKAKQALQDRDTQISTLQQEHEEEALSLEQQRQTLLKFEPRVLECFACNPVKLNVGGTYFSTSMANLTREPGTFFSAMFSGRWEIKTNPKDDAVFVDRSPYVFELIINYMRTGGIDLNGLNPQQLNALLKEADFYQIASLLKLMESLPKPTFSPQVKGIIQLSQDISRATNLKSGWSFAISLVAFSPSVREMKIRLIKGVQAMIGVAPRSILEANKDYNNCGWHVYAFTGSLFSQSGDLGKLFKRKINAGSVVAVKLDQKFNISFAVDGESWGVAFWNVAKDHSVPLHLSIGLHQCGDAVEML